MPRKSRQPHARANLVYRFEIGAIIFHAQAEGDRVYKVEVRALSNYASPLPLPILLPFSSTFTSFMHHSFNALRQVVELAVNEEGDQPAYKCYWLTDQGHRYKEDHELYVLRAML